MKLSVSAWSVQKALFSKKIRLYDFIDFCRKNGAEAVELLDCFWENEDQIVDIKKYIDEINMPVSAYSIGNDFVQEQESEIRKQIESVKKGIDIAERLDTRVLRVFSGSSKPGISFEKAKEGIIRSFKECAEYAEEKGITMVLENHGLFAGKSSQVKDIIDTVGSKNLRANTDTGNFLLVCEDPFDAIRNLVGYIGFVHFKDFKKIEQCSGEYYTAVDGTKYIGTIIGNGDVPLKDIVEFLRDNSYEGYLSIEYEGLEEPVDGTMKSIKYLKSLL